MKMYILLSIRIKLIKKLKSMRIFFYYLLTNMKMYILLFIFSVLYQDYGKQTLSVFWVSLGSNYDIYLHFPIVMVIEKMVCLDIMINLGRNVVELKIPPNSVIQTSIKQKLTTAT